MGRTVGITMGATIALACLLAGPAAAWPFAQGDATLRPGDVIVTNRDRLRRPGGRRAAGLRRARRGLARPARDDCRTARPRSRRLLARLCGEPPASRASPAVGARPRPADAARGLRGGGGRAGVHGLPRPAPHRLRHGPGRGRVAASSRSTDRPPPARGALSRHERGCSRWCRRCGRERAMQYDVIETLGDRGRRRSTSCRRASSPARRTRAPPSSCSSSPRRACGSRRSGSSCASRRCGSSLGALYFMHGDLKIAASTGGGVIAGLTRKGVLRRELLRQRDPRHAARSGSSRPSATSSWSRSPTGTRSSSTGRCSTPARRGSTSRRWRRRTFSSAAFGGEGACSRPRSPGPASPCCSPPVPRSEIQEIALSNSTLQVDGNFALDAHRRRVVPRREVVQRAGSPPRSSGEGLLQTFSGTGTVWIAPTQAVYEKLAHGPTACVSSPARRARARNTTGGK